MKRLLETFPPAWGWATAGLLAFYLIFMHSQWAFERSQVWNQWQQHWQEQAEMSLSNWIESQQVQFDERIDTQGEKVEGLMMLLETRTQLVVKRYTEQASTLQADWTAWVAQRQQEWWAQLPTFRRDCP